MICPCLFEIWVSARVGKKGKESSEQASNATSYIQDFGVKFDG